MGYCAHVVAQLRVNCVELFHSFVDLGYQVALGWEYKAVVKALPSMFQSIKNGLHTADILLVASFLS